jgi:uncharacterized coiled-coil DUF342 family protein
LPPEIHKFIAGLRLKIEEAVKKLGRGEEMAALKDDLAQLQVKMRSVRSDVKSLSDKVTLVSEKPDKVPRAIPLASKPKEVLSELRKGNLNILPQ